MREKFCCNNWIAQVPSIRETKTEELSNVKPEYLVQPILSMLNRIDNYCPVCGEGLKEESPPKVTSVRTPKPLPSGQPCFKCQGVGNLGADERGILTICPVCLGRKVLDSGNAGSVSALPQYSNVNPKKPINSDIIAKTEELKQKLKGRPKE